RRCGHDDHQGYIAKMPPFPYESPEIVVRKAPSCPVYLLLDHLQDPHNFGTILRSAAAFGVDAVFVPNQGQVKVTSAVARSSAGAVNQVAIAEVESLADWAEQLRRKGVRIVATAPDASRPIFDCTWTGPSAVVLGSETRGVSPEVLSVCNEQVVIPQSGELNSLNVAACASICLYEISRQRWLNSPRRPASSSAAPRGPGGCPPP
ncbi:MAG: RNA methyltransferase, partial [Planctomycetes bacterium]|nr:RNA methyltransferase [Planctomycetota bacterium]